MNQFIRILIVALTVERLCLAQNAGAPGGPAAPQGMPTSMPMSAPMPTAPTDAPVYSEPPTSIGQSAASMTMAPDMATQAMPPDVTTTTLKGGERATDKPVIEGGLSKPEKNPVGDDDDEPVVKSKKKKKMQIVEESPTAATANDVATPEVQALEKNLEAGVSGEFRPPLYEPNEPGGTLQPSERFSRIPLKPPMSEANWKRWAGPMLEKSYRIRRNDSLWGVSERLFGNPYLWPKVWQLNAEISNPHIIFPKLELSFSPGNPNAAPALAFKNFPGMTASELPLMATDRKLSFLEHVDQTLRQQFSSSQPPFQYFLLDAAPPAVAVVPTPENSERSYYTAGDTFPTKLNDGDYSLAQIQPLKAKGYQAYRVHWLGDMKVANRRATISRAFAEIAPGDLVMAQPFHFSQLSLHDGQVGADERERTEILPLQEGFDTVFGANMMIGIKFAGPERGPKVGSLLTVSNQSKKIGTVLLLDRDREFGTLWVIESSRELNAKIDRFD